MKTSAALHAPSCFKFGPFVVDGRRRLLWRDAAPVPVTAKALAVLDLLLRNRDRVVSKEELFEQLWPDTLVGENTLTRHISTLRKALEERPAEHRYIVTIPGDGYQFVADATEFEECPAELLTAIRPAGPADSGERPAAVAVSPATPAAAAPMHHPALGATAALVSQGRPTSWWRSVLKALSVGAMALAVVP